MAQEKVTPSNNGRTIAQNNHGKIREKQKNYPPH